MVEAAQKLSGRQIIDLIKRGLSAFEISARLGVPTARFIAIMEAAATRKVE
jgi:hypothetical protein